MSGGSACASRGTGAECRKFAPNIFNKSKCSSCFKQKEEHTAEALESNRATRKISKCGYLFVAPGWDFSNPLNRTKRWQRRWFVLYDDGELTYSVDEHPETVPQARIDMTRVLEVAAADDVTGHPYSLAITSAEGVTFVKGTCREETRWWADVLQVYSRNKGRHKRNATFPGGQTTILQVAPPIRSNTPNPTRPRFNSCRSESRNSTFWIPEATVADSPTSGGNSSLLSNTLNGSAGAHRDPEVENVLRNSMSSMRNTTLQNGTVHTYLGTGALNGSAAAHSSSTPTLVPSSESQEKPPIAPNDMRAYRDQPASSASPPTRDKLRAEDKTRRRMNQQGERPATTTVGPNEKLDDEACRRILLEHEKEREDKLRDIAASLTQPRVRRNKLRNSEPTRDVVDAVHGVNQDKLIRGDPDGCGLDISGTRYSPTSELRVDLPAEDLLNIKKGWLMKQSLNKEWNKHWFVLRGCGLMYYRDPGAEDKGIMDGVIDLNTVTAVTLVQVARNYGFQTVTWDDRGTTVLSAVTAGIRSSWMSAIRKAANLPDQENNADSHAICQENQQDVNLQSPTASMNENRERESIVPSTPLTPRSVLFSSDEEYRTASEGGRRESGDWSEMPVSPPLTRNGEWNIAALKGATTWPENAKHEWSELPPSPPLTRTALSRVKARSRSSSRSRVYKRSKSSPPSSRRSTLDSVRSEDLMMACCELGEEDAEEDSSLPESNSCLPTNDDSPLIVDLLDSQVYNNQVSNPDKNQSHPSTLLVIVERQEHEIENFKSQLNAARTDAANAEKELARLRQQKAEASIREKQVEELLNTIQRTEQMRNKDLEDLDKMKKMYNRDKEVLDCKLLETEAILRETTERCEMLTNELSSSHRTVEHLQAEVTALSNRLTEGIEENERLYARIRELEGKNSLSSSREKGRSFDSLSDLTNIDLDLDLNILDKERVMEEYEELRGRFEKAIQEIRVMRKELREAHATQDALELEMFAHKKDSERLNCSNQAQIQLMAARIQDLTSKLGGSEKQVRTLKQKLTKAESRDKRRSLSLKGRESFQISQEIEDKLQELENKMSAIELGKSAPRAVTTAGISCNKESSPNPKKEKKREDKNRNLDKRLRRKSLDSATSSEPMKVLIRLSTLETKVANAVIENVASDAEKDSSECSDASAPSVTSEVSLEVLSRLRKLERGMIKSKRRLEKCLNSTQAEERAEKCLRSVNEILEICLDQKKPQPSSQSLESASSLVSRLEEILREKMCELVKKRQALASENRLDEKEKARLIAERIAFESVIFSRLKTAMERKHERAGVFAELVETSQLISSLNSKVLGTKPKMYQNTNYIQYLTAALANRLVLVGGMTETQNQSQTVRRLEGLDLLLNKQRQVSEAVTKYKESQLNVLAEALALETLNLSESEQTELNNPSKLLEDRRIREAWALAQETVGKELVQAEVARFMTHCAQVYEQNLNFVTDNCLTFDATYNISLESWADAAREKLHQQMQLSINQLSSVYEDKLHKIKKGERRPDAKHDSRQLLSDYADVVAQKAVLDARISLLQEGVRVSRGASLQIHSNFVSSLICQEDALKVLLLDGDDNDGEDLVNSAEFAYLYQQFASQCAEGIDFGPDKLRNVERSIDQMEEEVVALKKCLSEVLGAPELSALSASRPVSDLAGVCSKCSDLRDRLRKLTERISRWSCTRCKRLQDKIQALSVEHKRQIDELKSAQERDLMNVKGEWDNQRHTLTTRYEQEAASLRDRARKLEQRLNAMDSEHSAHVNELRAAYQRSMSTELDTDAETRKRYKEEIKHLRALCEKGLLAMENSHRRIIAEMEEKHKQELESLRVEKEQALSEETQATLAALDAMRKAHEHEVQKEIAKFKREFFKQMQAREDIGILHKEHEQEMEEIKQEILSLSAKYSSKCVESAALEEKVGTLTKQVAQAQQHIMQLDQRNKQLRAHLVLETNDSSINETFQLLRGRDNEIAEQREEIHRLQQQLKHDSAPSQSAPLSHSLQRASRNTIQRASYTEDLPIKKSFATYKLDSSYSPNVIKSPANDKPDKGQDCNDLWNSLRARTALPHRQYQELMRSPTVKWSSRNCRSLPPTPTPSYNHPLYPPLPAVGMVAERKKRFEI